jgi:mono/diheme cytochrome c family protein
LKEPGVFSGLRYGVIPAAGILLAGAIVWLAAGGPTAGAEKAPDKKDNAWEVPKDAAEVKNPIAADAKSVAAGKIVYTQQCVACHGSTGKGDGPAAIALRSKPGDLSDPKTWQQTDGALYWKISEGREAMPVYKKMLTEEQRWNAVNYVRSLAKKPS